jgi:hypothetical protein
MWMQNNTTVPGPRPKDLQVKPDVLQGRFNQADKEEHTEEEEVLLIEVQEEALWDPPTPKIRITRTMNLKPLNQMQELTLEEPSENYESEKPLALMEPPRN